MNAPEDAHLKMIALPLRTIILVVRDALDVLEVLMD